MRNEIDSVRMAFVCITAEALEGGLHHLADLSAGHVRRSAWRRRRRQEAEVAVDAVADTHAPAS